MMKRLNKGQQNEMSDWIAKLNEAKSAIEEKWSEFEAAHGELSGAITAYNEVLGDVISWRDDIVSQMQDYQGERSDKWQEGDAGQQYQSWIDEWENLDFSEISVPELPDQPEPEHAETLENAPTEADSV